MNLNLLHSARNVFSEINGLSTVRTSLPNNRSSSCFRAKVNRRFPHSLVKVVVHFKSQCTKAFTPAWWSWRAVRPRHRSHHSFRHVLCRWSSETSNWELAYARLSDYYITLLQVMDSNGWPVFPSQFPDVLFRGSADKCAAIIYHSLRCCNSRLASTRSEACALLYLLMRKNFEHGPGRNFVRSHLQVSEPGYLGLCLMQPAIVQSSIRWIPCFPAKFRSWDLSHGMLGRNSPMRDITSHSFPPHLNCSNLSHGCRGIRLRWLFSSYSHVILVVSLHGGLSMGRRWREGDLLQRHDSFFAPGRFNQCVTACHVIDRRACLRCFLFHQSCSWARADVSNSWSATQRCVDHFYRKAFTQKLPVIIISSSPLQMIKSVSQLISEEVGIGSSRFQHSLSVINTYAISDKGMQVRGFGATVVGLLHSVGCY